MADLYKIFDILDNDNTPGAPGDDTFYEVFYDKDEEDGTPDDYFRVDKDGVTISSGDFLDLGAFGGQQFAVTDYGVTFNSGTRTSFEVSGSFPYAIRQTLGDPGGGGGEVDDLSVTIGTITPSSAGTVADGKFYLSFSGTNTPFAVSLTPVSQQYTTTEFYDQHDNNIAPFGALPSGTYSGVTVRDSAGYVRTISVTIPTEQQSATNYGVKYDFTFKDKSDQTYKVEIEERDYSGSVNTLTNSGNFPIVISREAASVFIGENQILPSSAIIELVSTSFREWEEFINADEEEYRVKFYQGTSALRWQGFIIPEQTTEVLYQPPYIIKLSANDRLGDLSAYRWGSEIGINSSLQLIDIIHRCLSVLNMSLGYRIVANIWEDSQDDTNDTPFHHTYVDTSCYVDETYDFVVSEILKSFGAHIYSWEGFWYIERIQEKSSTTVNYIEYSSDLTETADTNYNPIQTFKGATESNRWRWKGAQNQSFTNQYSKVKMNLLLCKKEAGITEGFENQEGWTEHTDSIAPFSTFIWKNPLNADASVTVGVSRQNSETYLQKTGTIEYSNSDSIKFDLTFACKMVDQVDNIITGGKDLSLRAPYFPFKWQLKIGDYYLDANASGTSAWNTSEVINQFFVQSLDSENKLSIERKLFGSVQESTYVLKIYGASVFESDLNYASATAMVTGIDGISTTSLYAGVRQIAKVGDTEDLDFYYYELQKKEISQGLTPDGSPEIYPADYNITTNPKVWVLINQWSYNHGVYSGDGLYGAYTETVFSNFDLEFLPNNQQPPENELLEVSASPSNKRELEINLLHHDLTGSVNGDQIIYTNFLRLSNGDQTATWSDRGGASQRIQNHFMDFLQTMVRSPRIKVNGSFESDQFANPTVTLNTPTDGDRYYWMPGINLDYKNSKFKGEVEEILSDNTPNVGDFDSSDFSSSDFKT